MECLTLEQYSIWKTEFALNADLDKGPSERGVRKGRSGEGRSVSDGVADGSGRPATLYKPRRDWLWRKPGAGKKAGLASVIWSS